MKLEKEKIIRKIKSETGSITVFVLSTMLLVTGVIFVSYFNMMNKNSTQLAELNKIQEEYLQTSDMSAMDQAYDEAYNPPTVSTLIEGDWVEYVDATGTTRKCIVLWDESSGYGIQIITQNTVEDVTIGSTDFDEAIEEYNNAIETLNNEAMKYLNTEYASDARCVGSVPNNKNSEATTSSGNYYYWDEGTVKDLDENYVLDNDQMNKLGIEYTETGIEMGDYWMASRNRGALSAGQDSGRVRAGPHPENWFGYPIVCKGNRMSGVADDSHVVTCGLRPVFTLRTEVKLVGGSGTQEDPYILGI